MKPQLSQPELTIRDIQLPDAISWWPLAWGWWALLAAMIVLIFLGLALTKYLALKKEQRLAPEPIRPILQREVIAIHHMYHKNKDDTWLVQQLAQVLRKTVLLESSEAKKNSLAGLIGVDWLHVLNHHFGLNKTDDKSGKKSGFVSKLGLALIEAPYRKDYEFDAESLVKLTYWALTQPTPQSEFNLKSGLKPDPEPDFKSGLKPNSEESPPTPSSKQSKEDVSKETTDA